MKTSPATVALIAVAISLVTVGVVELLRGSPPALAIDPEAVEARWIEFDEWVDRRERELTLQLDPELYRKLYGEN